MTDAIQFLEYSLDFYNRFVFWKRTYLYMSMWGQLEVPDLNTFLIVFWFLQGISAGINFRTYIIHYLSVATIRRKIRRIVVLYVMYRPQTLSIYTQSQNVFYTYKFLVPKGIWCEYNIYMYLKPVFKNQKWYKNKLIW